MVAKNIQIHGFRYVEYGFASQKVESRHFYYPLAKSLPGLYHHSQDRQINFPPS